MKIFVWGKGRRRQSEPEDWVEESPGTWCINAVFKGQEGDYYPVKMYMHGDHQCALCGIPIDQGEVCDECFHRDAKRTYALNKLKGGE